jgi:hypothetical protein
MANKKTLAEKKSSGKPALLEEAARTIGAVLGEVAVKTGLAARHATGERIIGGRFQKSGKQRLPRKVKKQHQKVA